MNALSKCLGLLVASLALASCGGGGGSGNDGGGGFQPTPSGTLELRATTTQLPLNRDNIGPFFGSPFMAELDITWRRSNGDLVSGQEVAVSINPVTVAAFSTLDDPTTPWTGQTADPPTHVGNEFLTLLGSGPVDVTGGHGTVFIHSGDISGNATVTVTAREAGAVSDISRTITFNVANIAAPLPASIVMNASPSGIYVQGTPGTTNSIISAVVRDGGGQLIPNPGSGNTTFNNIEFTIVTPGDSGTLSGSTQGSTARARTVQGVASVSYLSGTVTGPIQIRATVDRADNNVDNGISQPLTTIATVVVSDGKLFSLAITSPTQNAILVDHVTGSATIAEGQTLPVTPNGAYRLTVSALATDRQGNPVAPGTVIRFGLIDSPVTGFPGLGSGSFVISGPDGDPQEGGTLFTAPTGHFTTAGGGAGPGDTLLVFGDLVAGNRDLESARVIARINSAISLNTVIPFNRNDDTGSSVNYGPVIPYVIGRAVDGNIGASGVTNSAGVASVRMNYPVSRLGKAVYVYAQGDGTDSAGIEKKITDIAAYVYPGVADAILTANPSSIPGNTTSAVTVCLMDNFGAPLQGAFVNFAFSGLPVGASGTVDGTPGGGSLAHATGPDGCAVAIVRTVGVADATGGGDGPQVIFTFGSADPAPVDITGSGTRSLTAAPSAFRGSGGVVTLTLRDSAGNPIPGVQISVQCTGDVSVAVPPGATNAQGQTTATIADIGLNDFGNPGSGECTFTAATGEETIVTFEGIDLCAAGTSPPPPPGVCDTPPATPQTLTVNISNALVPTCGLAVGSTPPGIACSVPVGATPPNTTCNAPFTQGQVVTLTATLTGATCPPTTTVTFGGGCVGFGANQATANMTTAQTCAVSATP